MEFFRELVEQVNKRTPLSGIGVDVADSTNGMTVNATVVAAASGSGNRLFQLIPLGGKVRVTASTLAGDVPLGMYPTDNPIFDITVEGFGVVFGKVTYEADTGAITTREILAGETLPADTDTETHVLLGGFSVDGDDLTVNNVAYGPVDWSVCPIWTAEDPLNTWKIGLSPFGI